jgi:hypothetical protein
MISLGCSTAALAEQSPQFHLLGKVKGYVKIVPKGGKPSKGFIGDTIDSFSTLILGKNASATVMCNDDSTRSIPSGKHQMESICKNTRSNETTSGTRKPGEQTLTDADRLALDADVKNLQQQPIDNDAKGIAIAYLYSSKGLDKEAIDELERLVAEGSRTTAVYQLLGDIYHDRKISEELAIDRYQTGLKLAKKEGNVKAQKYIQSQLKVLRKIAN